MRATTGKVQAWFILTGLGGGLMYLVGSLFMVGGALGISMHGSPPPNSGGPVGLVLGCLYGLFGLYNLLFVLVGLKLRGLLLDRPRLVEGLVKLNMGLSFMSINLLAAGLNYYLLRLLRRLAVQERDLQSRARAPGFEAIDR